MIRVGNDCASASHSTRTGQPAHSSALGRRGIAATTTFEEEQIATAMTASLVVPGRSPPLIDSRSSHGDGHCRATLGAPRCVAA